MDSLDFSSLKIMLVEDEKRAAEHLHSILKLYFEHITLAFNGCEAIEHIKKKMVGDILLRMRMYLLNLVMIKHCRLTKLVVLWC